MSGHNLAYLDLSALPAVGPALLSPRPSFVWAADGRHVLWANAAGAGFFGASSMESLLERRFSDTLPSTSQIARLARALPLGATRLERIGFVTGGRLQSLPATCTRIRLEDGASAILVMLEAPRGGRVSLVERAEQLADIVVGEDCLVAILDASGDVVAASGGLDALAAAEVAIEGLIAGIDRSPQPLLKRAIRVDRARRPAGIARFELDDRRFHLLVIGPAEWIGVEPAAAEPEPRVSAVTVAPVASATRVAELPEGEPEAQDAIPAMDVSPRKGIEPEPQGTELPIEAVSEPASVPEAEPIVAAVPAEPEASDHAVALPEIDAEIEIKTVPAIEEALLPSVEPELPLVEPSLDVEPEAEAKPVEPVAFAAEPVEMVVAEAPAPGPDDGSTEDLVGPKDVVARAPLSMADIVEAVSETSPAEPVTTAEAEPDRSEPALPEAILVKPADDEVLRVSAGEPSEPADDDAVAPVSADAPSEPADDEVPPAAADEPSVDEPLADEPHAAEAEAAEPAFRFMAPTGPVRFVFQMDAEGRFSFVSPEFASVVGPRSAATVGASWQDVAAVRGLDEKGTIAALIARRDTWSGATLSWPVDDTDQRVSVDLAALPAFSRDRSFEGYRGFGVIRPSEIRREPPAPVEDKRATVVALQKAPVVAEPSNVVRLPRPAPVPGDAERLTMPEQDAFRRIAVALGAKVGPVDPVQPASSDEAIAPEAFEADEPDTSVEETAADDAAPEDEAVPAGDVSDEDALPAGDEIAETDVSAPEEPVAEAAPPEADLGETVEDAAEAAERIAGDVCEPEAEAPDVETPVAALEAPAVEEPEEFEPEEFEPDEELDLQGEIAPEEPVEPEPEAVEPAAPAIPEPSVHEVVQPVASDPKLLEELAEAGHKIAELEAILDTATDGVAVVDAEGRIVRINRSAEALFGVETGDVAGLPFTHLLAEESRKAALDYLEGLAQNGVASLLNDGREVIGRVPQGGLIPLFMTMGRLGETGKFCAVLRDITQWKNAEEELINARRAAETASMQKSDFLAKVSHEIRTPLNAIIGFSEVMMEERFGPIGTERYKQYLRDIHVSGAHLMSLLNDLLDLSKIEAGKMELNFEAVALNDIVMECVALMQPQANRERIIIRTSLSSQVPSIVADPRSIRQIVLNLVSNAIKFTLAGGQVIVSTALEERGEVTLRIRDTGIGMSEKDVETALMPFRQVATSAKHRSDGTGLGLPLTKALVEANRAAFLIDSAVGQGTLIRVTFPSTRVLVG